MMVPFAFQGKFHRHFAFQRNNWHCVFCLPKKDLNKHDYNSIGLSQWGLMNCLYRYNYDIIKRFGNIAQVCSPKYVVMYAMVVVDFSPFCPHSRDPHCFLARASLAVPIGTWVVGYTSDLSRILSGLIVHVFFLTSKGPHYRGILKQTNVANEELKTYMHVCNTNSVCRLMIDVPCLTP